jgi:hypothetical protein
MVLKSSDLARMKSEKSTVRCSARSIGVSASAAQFALRRSAQRAALRPAARSAAAPQCAVPSRRRGWRQWAGVCCGARVCRVNPSTEARVDWACARALRVCRQALDTSKVDPVLEERRKKAADDKAAETARIQARRRALAQR